MLLRRLHRDGARDQDDLSPPRGTGLRRGLTWDRLTDGKVRRLKAGKHFDGSVREFAERVADVAARRGIAVRMLRDELGRTNHYLWLQFADAEIPLGAACPRCGSLELLRTHE